MFCKQCGTQNDDEAKYCKNCGSPFGTDLHQPAMMTKASSLPGVACHYSGCTNPVIGQCPGYKTDCLRYYCAVHSIEPYCSVCSEKILRDAAIQAVYEDYLLAAQQIPGSIGCGWASVIALFSILICSALGSGIGSILGGGDMDIQENIMFFTMGMGIVFTIFLMWLTHTRKQKAVAKVATTKPGFKEFFTAYEQMRNSADMVTALRGLLLAGTATTVIQEYQLRQDIREIVKKMRT